ncbi:MAG: shikimate kinase [Acetobacter sp.]|nr:shikimate kinase [Bacteroides sp.]MCM1340862.1 shikimate kinase [Acetobacter sp.]MCM1432581.1 shikimate kinase [Clostridiales bacterium]
MNNIILCGFMGSGKTTIGMELAKIMGRKFVDTDELIEKEQGIAIKAIFAAHGEDYFRELEFECCKKIADMKNCVVSTGGGALTFQRNVDVLKTGGKIVFLDADFDVICSRIGNSKTRPLFQDKTKAKALYDERKSKYLAASDFVVDGNMSARKTALEIQQMFK